MQKLAKKSILLQELQFTFYKTNLEWLLERS